VKRRKEKAVQTFVGERSFIPLCVRLS